MEGTATMARGNRNAVWGIEPGMTKDPAPRRRAAVALLALSVAIVGLPACRPGATVQNNGAAPLIVDGNYDDANFVVPSDEGSGDENAAAAGPGGDESMAPGNSSTDAPPRPHDGARH